MVRLGFTGTQRGTTPDQIFRYLELLVALKPSEMHHGDCIGADDDAWSYTLIAGAAGAGSISTHCHPPTNNTKRAYTKNDVTYPPRPYLERNHDIVDACDVLVAAPGEREEQLRSGTWATVRYARKQGKVVYIIYP